MLIGDGQLEVAVNDMTGKMHVLNSQGQEISGFPIQTGSSIQASTSFADVNNDGRPEMIVASGTGQLEVRMYNGASVIPFPILLSGASNSSPIVTFLDNDNRMEIVLGTFVGLDAIDLKSQAGTGTYWNMHRANLKRTGYYVGLTSSSPVAPQAGVETPKVFALLPANPNPFNPTVNLSFTLPVAARATLEIFDLMGRKVATLVDGARTAGVHTCTWSASGSQQAASGIYIVSFRAEGQSGSNYNATQKILLVK
jgi:hypothetical protein